IIVKACRAFACQRVDYTVRHDYSQPRVVADADEQRTVFAHPQIFRICDLCERGRPAVTGKSRAFASDQRANLPVSIDKTDRIFVFVADVDAPRTVDGKRLRRIQLRKTRWSTIAFVTFLAIARDGLNDSIAADSSDPG